MNGLVLVYRYWVISLDQTPALQQARILPRSCTLLCVPKCTGIGQSISLETIVKMLLNMQRSNIPKPVIVNKAKKG